MSEKEKEKAKQIFDQMLDIGCCTPNLLPCRSCVHEHVCKRADENRIKCDDYKQKISYMVHRNIDQLFQPIFKWIQHHYPSGGVSFLVDSKTAKMKIDYGPYVFDDSLKNCALSGFNSPVPMVSKADAKEETTDE